MTLWDRMFLWNSMWNFIERLLIMTRLNWSLHLPHSFIVQNEKRKNKMDEVMMWKNLNWNYKRSTKRWLNFMVLWYRIFVATQKANLRDFLFFLNRKIYRLIYHYFVDKHLALELLLGKSFRPAQENRFFFC